MSDGTLYEVRDLIRANPSLLRIRVEGHTDHTGTDRYNLVLSERRAGTFIEWLVNQGVDANRLEGFGCGKLYPLGEGDSDDARQLNRRVEYIVLEPPDPDAPAVREGCLEVGSVSAEEEAHVGLGAEAVPQE